MLRSVGAYLIAAVLLLHSNSAFRQALGEFRDTEPGSLLFGVLQVVISTSAVASAFGLVARKRWAAWSVGVCGVATMGLLAVQPLYSPMDSQTQRAIWLAAAGIGVAAAGVSWFARRIARRGVAPTAAADTAQGLTPPAALLPEGRRPAEPIIAPVPDPQVARTAGSQRDDDKP